MDDDARRRRCLAIVDALCPIGDLSTDPNLTPEERESVLDSVRESRALGTGLIEDALAKGTEHELVVAYAGGAPVTLAEYLGRRPEGVGSDAGPRSPSGPRRDAESAVLPVRG
jgi:hypothetical protein